ncbi:MAG TPA: DUF3999 domain-containing protein [Vicinamibacteria bacterium]
MKWTILRVWGALLVFIAVPARAQDPRKEDFAYGIAVDPRTDAPLYRLRLPIAVYRGLTRHDLGDLRMFNAGGELVPHELWSPPDAEEVERRTAPSRVFPLASATPEELSAVRVLIESGADRASVALLAGARTPAGVAAYLIDPGSIESPYVAERLVLHWEEPNEGFVRGIQVEESDDLSSWRTVASAVVADLTRDGERLLRNEIPLDPVVPRYLKITANDGPIPMTLTGVDLTLSSRTERVETAWIDVTDLESEEGGLLFETAGPVLVEAIEVAPSERNTWTEVELYSRPDGRAPWVLRASSAVYRFDAGADTRLNVGRTRDRYWKLTTERARGGFGGTPPTLRVGYRPDEVVFVARGEAPFEIAYGSGRIGPAPRSNESLRTLTSSKGEPLVPATDVALGEPRALAGESALREPLIPDWKRFVLWGVLGAASLALLLTARAALAAAKPDP